MLYRNVSSQKIAVFAYTAATGAAKTGDAANITAYLSKDFGAAAQTNDVNPTELDATNMPGWYVFDLMQAETNAEVLVLAAKSATAGVVVDQMQVFTQDASISSRASQASVDDVPTNAELAAALAGADDATLAAIAALNNLSQAQAQTAATAALNAYDPPTKAELDSGLAALNDISAADVKTALEADGSKLDHLWEMTEDDGGVRRLTANALEQAPAGGAGSGTGAYTDTVNDGTNPLDGVRVQLSTDAAGTNRVYEAFTDALGVFEMHPDPGTYYRWLDLAGYAFEQGVEVVVA
jgi:hypothetical protein